MREAGPGEGSPGETIRERACRFVGKLKWSVRFYGIDLTAAGILVKILSVLNRDTAGEWYKRTLSRRFDKRFHVDTGGVLPVGELGLSEDQEAGAHLYQTGAVVSFGLVLSELGITYENYVFVDYGSGKGRTLVQAAHFPFKEIVGVEISGKLHDVAEKNLHTLFTARLRCRKIRSVCEDATRFDPLDDPSVLYFFHPFNEDVLNAVLVKIRASLRRSPRHIVVVYQRPVFGEETARNSPEARHLIAARLSDVFDRTDFLRRVPARSVDARWDVYETFR